MKRQRISTDKDVDKVARAALGRGWEVVRRKRHTKLRWPPTGAVAFVPVTPSDRHAAANLRAELERAESQPARKGAR